MVNSLVSEAAICMLFGLVQSPHSFVYEEPLEPNTFGVFFCMGQSLLSRQKMVNSPHSEAAIYMLFGLLQSPRSFVYEEIA